MSDDSYIERCRKEQKTEWHKNEQKNNVAMLKGGVFVGFGLL